LIIIFCNSTLFTQLLLHKLGSLVATRKQI
jgi:hypothetical protein